MRMTWRGNVLPGLAPARRLLALADRDRMLLLRAVSLVACVRALLWLLPSRLSLKIVRRLEQVAPRPQLGHPPAVDGVRWAVEAASRRIPHATCLTQAIAAQLLLRHYGYESRLCLGVTRSSAGEFLAHAWIERNGHVVVGGAQSAGFTRLPALSTTFQRDSGVERR